MATLTSLGFSVFSRYDGDGIRRARNDIRSFQRDTLGMSRSTAALTKAVVLFGPAGAVAFGAAAKGAATAAVAFGAAGAGLAIYGLAVRNTIKHSKAAQAQISRLKGAFNTFGLSAKGIIVNTLTHGVTAAIHVMKALEPVIKPVARAVRGIVLEMERFAKSQAMKSFGQWLAVTAPAAIKAFWRATVNLGIGLFNLGKQLGLFNTSGFLNWLVAVTQKFKEWSTSPGAAKFAQFFKENWPHVKTLVTNLLRLATAVTIALGPLAALVLRALAPMAGWLATVAERCPWLVQGLWALYAVSKALTVITVVVNAFRALVGATALSNVQVLRAIVLWTALKVRMVGAWIQQAAMALMSTARALALQAIALVRAGALWVALRVRMAAATAVAIIVRIRAIAAALTMQVFALVRAGAAWLVYRTRILLATAASIAARIRAVTFALAAQVLALIRTGAAWLVFRTRILLATAASVAARIRAVTAALALQALGLVRTGLAWLVFRTRILLATAASIAARLRAATAALLAQTLMLARTGLAWLLYRTRVLLATAASVAARVRALTAALAVQALTLARVGLAWLLYRTRVLLATALGIAARIRAMTAALAAQALVLARAGLAWLLYRTRVLLATALGIAARIRAMTAALFAQALMLARVGLAWILYRTRVLLATALAVAARIRALTAALFAQALMLARTGLAWLLYRTRVLFSTGIAVLLSIRTVTAALLSQTLMLARTGLAWLVYRARVVASTGAAVAAGLRAVTAALAAQALMVARTGLAWLVFAARAAVARVVMIAIRSATLAWTAAQWLLNAALLANPIGIVIAIIVALVAAIVIAYTRCTTFRNIVNAAFRAVWTAAQFMGRIIVAVCRSFISMWISTWNRMRSVFNAAWGAIRGTFNAMRNTISGIWNSIQRFVIVRWALMWARVRQLLSLARSAIQGALASLRRWLAGVWQSISSFATNTWGRMWNRIRQVFNTAWGAIRGTFSVLRRWLASAWHGISSFATNTWGRMWNRVRQVFNTAWGAVRGTFGVLRRWLAAAWSSISSFATNKWGAMWSRIRGLFNAAWGAIRGTMGVMARTLSGIWKSIVNTAGRIWNGLKGMVAKPINFVIGFVGDRLIPMANTALKAVLGGKAPQIKNNLSGFKIPGYAEGGVVGYKSGGILPGYSPGKDNLMGSYKGVPIGLSGGEGILRPEVMRAPGMASFLHKANSVARAGGVGGVTNLIKEGFAKGGQFRGAKGGEREQSLWEKQGMPPGGPYGMFAKGGVVGGVRTAANFDGGGVLGSLKSWGSRLFNSATGIAQMASKKLLQEKGFNMIAQKVLGKTYDNARKWMGASGSTGQIAGGVMSKVVAAIVNWVCDKINPGGGGAASSVVAAAVKYIGKGDRGGGDNNQNQFNDQWGMPGAPWCANFVSTCIKDAKAEKFYPGYPTASVFGYYNAMKKVPFNQAQPGDLRTTGMSTHINIVEKKVGGGVATIGGNQGPKVNRRVDTSGHILRPKPGAPGGGATKSSGSAGSLASMGGSGGGAGGGGRAYFTHFWDAQVAGPGGMTKDTIASSYIPLGSKLTVSKGGKSANGTINDLGPAKFVYQRHPGIAVLDLATPMLPGDGYGTFKITKVGSGRTLYGKNLRGYAKGGQLGSNELAIAGEAGPEAILGGRQGGSHVYKAGTSVSTGDTHIHIHGNLYVKSKQEFEQMVITAVSEAKRKKKL